MELEGLDVVNYLNGPDTVRDGTLVSLSVHQIASEPIVELTFEVSRGSGTRMLKLELRDVQEFDYGYDRGNPPIVIEFLKCITTESGEFYLSLDPYSEHEALASERDNEFFRSKFVRLTTLDSGQP